MTVKHTPLEALEILVRDLNDTTWSSWQSTSKFSIALNIAEQVIKREKAREAALELLELLEQAASIMKNCEVSSGICMCGDSMDGHQGQFESGHVPVDSGEYYKDCFLQKAIAAIAKATEKST